jgi:hypothetical protein
MNTSPPPRTALSPAIIQAIASRAGENPKPPPEDRPGEVPRRPPDETPAAPSPPPQELPPDQTPTPPPVIEPPHDPPQRAPEAVARRRCGAGAALRFGLRV